MKIKILLKRNFRVLGVTGIISAWITIGTAWIGLSSFAFIGYLITSGLFGLALVSEKF